MGHEVRYEFVGGDLIVLNDDGVDIDCFPAHEYIRVVDQFAAAEKEYPGIKELGE